MRSDSQDSLIVCIAIDRQMDPALEPATVLNGFPELESTGFHVMMRARY